MTNTDVFVVVIDDPAKKPVVVAVMSAQNIAQRIAGELLDAYLATLTDKDRRDKQVTRILRSLDARKYEPALLLWHTEVRRPGQPSFLVEARVCDRVEQSVIPKWEAP